MCGIFGSINYSLPLEAIRSKLLHRGPDAQNSFSSEKIQFHHFRLSILDIENGGQPMSRNGLTIIFNGQIYNHLNVRRKFDLVCQTNSDTETILAAYEKLGVKCLSEFDGMFAFAIYDSNRQELFLARDRAGKKPLYIYNRNGKFLFSSELNALNAVLPLQIDEEKINQYLRFGSFYKAQTPYEEVEELENGTYKIISTNTLSISTNKWWSIHDQYKKECNDSFEQSILKVDGFLREDVKNRMLSSDLEVGAFLSGGIDSGLVTSIASEYTDRLRTFTVAFDGAYNEAPLAKLVADKYNTIHTEIHVSFGNLKTDIEGILCQYGEPFADSSAIPSYYVSKAAKEHLTVILNGDGADELFGGYRRYVPFRYFDLFHANSFNRKTCNLLIRILPLANEKKSWYNYIYRLIDLISKNSQETYLSSTSDIFEGFQNNFKSKKSLSDVFINDINNVLESDITSLKKIMSLDFEALLFGDLLVKMDIATMAHSLEGRSPFLSKNLLEYAPSMPDRNKINGTKTKFLLRELAKKYLPIELINQPKRGFEIPLKKWVDDELKEVIFDSLNSTCYSRKYIDYKFIEQLKNKRVSVSSEKRAKMLWSLFALEVWHKGVYSAA